MLPRHLDVKRSMSLSRKYPWYKALSKASNCPHSCGWTWNIYKFNEYEYWWLELLLSFRQVLLKFGTLKKIYIPTTMHLFLFKIYFGKICLLDFFVVTGMGSGDGRGCMYVKCCIRSMQDAQCIYVSHWIISKCVRVNEFCVCVCCVGRTRVLGCFPWLVRVVDNSGNSDNDWDEGDRECNTQKG